MYSLTLYILIILAYPQGRICFAVIVVVVVVVVVDAAAAAFSFLSFAFVLFCLFVVAVVGGGGGGVFLALFCLFAFCCCWFVCFVVAFGGKEGRDEEGGGWVRGCWVVQRGCDAVYSCTGHLSYECLSC